MILPVHVIFMSNRELVKLKTEFVNFNGKNSALLFIRSIEHPSFPENKTYVRAKMILAGNYIEEIAPNKCKVGISRTL